MSNPSIFKELEKKDRERTDEFGNSVDIWLNPGEFTDEDIKIKRIYDLQTKINQKNKLILTSSDEPLNEIKNLACPHAFMLEAKEDLIDVSKPLSEVFNKYTNTLRLAKLNFSVYTHKNEAIIDSTITFTFKRNYSGKILIIQLPLNNFKKEVQESLKQNAYRWELESMDKELKF